MNVLNYYLPLRNRFIKLLVKINPVIATKVIYRRTFNKSLNLSKPKDFNEKIQWLKLYYKNPKVILCADKYTIRDYCIEKKCPEILNPIYGVYDDANQINWDELPQKFVLKTTNASGTNIICYDKDKLNKKDTIEKLNKWLKIDYGFKKAEIHYSKMKPRIICEEFIETNDELPLDYKFFCFNGKPQFFSVVYGRDTSDIKNFEGKIYIDLNGNQLFLQKKEEVKKVDDYIPNNLEQMIRYSEILADDFPFVRVDFYDGKSKPIIGEMTFTPTAGLARNFTDATLLKLGSMIKLPS